MNVRLVLVMLLCFNYVNKGNFDIVNMYKCLDYCNSVLAALPQSTTEPLQRVQNAAARLIFNLGRREHVSP